MEITRYGAHCFLIKLASITLLADPHNGPSGFLPNLPAADIITLSFVPNSQEDPLSGQAKRRLLRGPGEYEIADNFILGVRTHRDAEKGSLRGHNTIFRYNVEGLHICHLGRLGHVPSSDHSSAIGSVDVLFVALGEETLSAAAASETVGILEPRIVIPMGTDALPGEPPSEPLAAFLKDLGIAEALSADRLSVTATSLPAETQVTLLSLAA